MFKVFIWSFLYKICLATIFKYLTSKVVFTELKKKNLKTVVKDSFRQVKIT